MTQAEIEVLINKNIWGSMDSKGNFLNEILKLINGNTSPTSLVYRALLTQSSQNQITSGLLTIGNQYCISTYIAGDDFANIATVISGTINTSGCVFIAIGTTPTDFSNGSTLIDTPQPIATVLENTLGGTITYAYDSVGIYNIKSSSLFTANKTLVLFGATSTTNDTGFISCDASGNTASLYRLVTTTVLGATDNLLEQTAIEIQVYP